MIRIKFNQFAVQIFRNETTYGALGILPQNNNLYKFKINIFTFYTIDFWTSMKL
jgi:hypothetical protein